MTMVNVTVVDDDEAVRDSLRALLEAIGYKVAVFAAGDAYLQSPMAGREAALILDFHLPGLDGIEVLRRLRAAGGGAAVIMISGKASATLRAKALRHDAVAMLEKPLRNPEFLDTLRAACARSLA